MFGSLANRMYEGKQFGELHVGMGATEMCYSDRHAYTVQKVISDKRVVVTRDKVKRIDKNGASDCQSYEYESVPLFEGEAKLTCTNLFIAANRDNIIGDCPNANCDGGCDGCKFYKKRKPTNGITLALCKHGWKRVGTDDYFMLGEREEYYDYSF